MRFVMEKFWGTKEATGSVGALSRQTLLCLSPLGQEASQLSFFPHFIPSLPPLYMNWLPHSTLLRLESR